MVKEEQRDILHLLNNNGDLIRRHMLVCVRMMFVVLLFCLVFLFFFLVKRVSVIGSLSPQLFDGLHSSLYSFILKVNLICEGGTKQSPLWLWMVTHTSTSPAHPLCVKGDGTFALICQAMGSKLRLSPRAMIPGPLLSSMSCANCDTSLLPNSAS